MSAELAHGVGALGVGFDYASPSTFQKGYDVDGYSNIQYHTPADLLPFGLAAKVGYVPNMSATTQLSAKESDSTITDRAEGKDMKMLQLSAAPIDGLSIKGDITDVQGEGGISGEVQDGISANVGAKYTMGQFSVGYTEGGYQPATGAAADDRTITYENKFVGAQFDINDALSVSYNEDESLKSSRNAIADTASTSTTTDVTMDQTTLQIAYTVGGATLGIADIEVDNADYTEGKTETMTVISLGISF